MTDATAPLNRLTAAERIGVQTVIVIFGATIYALFMLRSTAMEPNAFGADIYDQLWLAIRDGRFDLPARVLRLEGHYWPDGTAMMYHGVAPLLTRILLDPFVTIGAGSLAPLSIWLWTTLGSLTWHVAFLRIGTRFGAGAGLLAVIGVCVWIGGPGLLLTANYALYHEPVALAYAITGAFVLVWTRAAAGDRFAPVALVFLATLAAVAVHARPNIAIGLYLATGIAMTQVLWQRRRSALPVIIAALAMLATGGGSYLALNKAKFGATTSAHGSFTPGELQYGIAYWEMEEPGNPRQQAFEEYGRFNAARIVPNALMYLGAPPRLLSPAANEAARDLHHAVTTPLAGYGRIEAPTGGMLFLWPFWLILAGIGVGALLQQGRPYAGLLAGLATSSLVTLSYPTITLRYHVELWPLIAAVALLGIARLPAGEITLWQRRILVLALGIGIGVSIGTAVYYTNLFRTQDDSAFAEWTEAECIARAEAKELDAARVTYVCRDPMIESRS
ncbi:MAG: hypothetical protein RID11_07585 [Roseovarius sp.]|jgi:hypothetical protein|uniref:hypothetical protein n=1 Tax=Roseovarius sp. TaxID=1486281 RepID=UPI0032EFBF64